MNVDAGIRERRMALADRAKSLREEGKTLDEIAKIMGYHCNNSVRMLLGLSTQPDMFNKIH